MRRVIANKGRVVRLGVVPEFMPYTGMKNALNTAAAAALLLVSACSELPSQTDTEGTARSDQEKVALCYTAKTTTVEELTRMALGFCPEGTSRVEVLDHDTFMNDCPISKKNRVTYRCLAY